MKVLVEYGPEGRPTGEADVYFRTHQDAVLAMSKDREYISKQYVCSSEITQMWSKMLNTNMTINLALFFPLSFSEEIY